MGRLVLIRHGESEGNRDRCFTRTPDVPMTPVGHEQVRAAAEWVARRCRPSAIVTSPFRRARETAAIVAARLGLAVQVEEDLRERSYGSLAGKPYAAARACGDYDPAAYWLWRHVTGEWRAGGVVRNAGIVLVEHDRGRWGGATAVDAD
jgi:broad specificity phosphatase PhoE